MMLTSKLDVGGGRERSGITTIDINPLASVIHNLNNYPWPIRDNSFLSIDAHHVLEHLDNPTEAMREIYRISKPHAIVSVRVPWWKSDQYSNPAHVHYFKPEWFYRLYPGDSAWADIMEDQCRMNFRLVKEKKLRGRLRPWKIYEYHACLEALK